MVLAATDLGSNPYVKTPLDGEDPLRADDELPSGLPSPDTLLALTQSYCAQALSNADRLQDYLQAELILAFWYLRQGRFLEGQYSLAAVSRSDIPFLLRKLLQISYPYLYRLAICCKLHRIDREVIQETMELSRGVLQHQSWWDGSLLGRPKSKEELALRVSLFWQVWYNISTEDSYLTLLFSLTTVTRRPRFKSGSFLHTKTPKIRTSPQYGLTPKGTRRCQTLLNPSTIHPTPTSSMNLQFNPPDPQLSQ